MSEYSKKRRQSLPHSVKSPYSGNSLSSCDQFSEKIKNNFHVSLNELTDDEIDLSGAETKFIIKEIAKFVIEGEKRDSFLKRMTETLEHDSTLLEVDRFYPEDFHELYFCPNARDEFRLKYNIKRFTFYDEWETVLHKFDEGYNWSRLWFHFRQNLDFADASKDFKDFMNSMCRWWSLLEIEALKQEKAEEGQGDNDANQKHLEAQHTIIRGILDELLRLLSIRYAPNGMVRLEVKNPNSKDTIVAKPDLMIYCICSEEDVYQFPAIVAEIYGPEPKHPEMSPVLKKRKIETSASFSSSSWDGLGFEASDVGVIGRSVEANEGTIDHRDNMLPGASRDDNARNKEAIVHERGDRDNTPLTKQKEDCIREIKQSTPNSLDISDDKSGPRKSLTEMIKACPASLSGHNFQTATTKLFGQHVIQIIGCGQRLAKFLPPEATPLETIEMVGFFVINSKVYFTKGDSTSKYWKAHLTNIKNYKYGDDKLNFKVSNWNLNLGKKNNLLALMAFIKTYYSFITEYYLQFLK